MSSAVYLSPDQKSLNVSSVNEDPHSVKRSNGYGIVQSIIACLFSAIFMIVLLTPAILSFTDTKGKIDETSRSNVVAQASGYEWTRFLMCDVFPEPADKIYQYTNTTDLNFMIRSKSALTGGVDGITNGLNWFLEATNPGGFNNINSNIIGYNVTEATELENPVDTEKSAEDRFNKGAQVNPFDRFGVAGLKFTGYMGEWKHIVVNACAENPQAHDPKTGLFYEDRLVPRSVWEDVKISADPRSQVFSPHLPPLYGGFLNVLANVILTMAKTVVVLTVSFVSIAFSNVLVTFGLEELLAGENGGLIGAMFNSVFMPFIIPVFALVGISIIAKAVKGMVRKAFTTALRGIVMFFAALLIAFSPGWLISLPNNFAVVVQAALLSATNTGLAGGGGMCATSIGSFKGNLIDGEVSSDGAVDDIIGTENIIESASANIRSSIGCQMWQMFLFKPWVKGQFGTDWNELWGNGKTPDWAPSGSAELKNDPENKEMVGDPSVPMGGGAFINNWALFQISTQTDVHSPIGNEGEPSKYTSGVSNDWWRIVDVLSNYKEMVVKENAVNEDGEDIVMDIHKPSDKISVLSQWDTWIGGNMMERIWISFSALIIAIIGSAPIMFFAFLSAMFAIGATIAISFAPIVLLVGAMSESGWQVFRGWVDLVVKSTAYRVVAGVLMVISVLLTSAALKMMEDVSWENGVLFLIVATVSVIKAKDVAFRAVASMQTAGYSMTTSGQRVHDLTRGFVKKTVQNPISSSGKAAGTLAGAAVASKMNGGTITQGLGYGFKKEIENIKYRNMRFRGAATQYEQTKQNRGGDKNYIKEQKYCHGDGCGQRLDDNDTSLGMNVFSGARDASGHYYCERCLEEGNIPSDARYVQMRIDPQKDAEIGQERSAEFSSKGLDEVGNFVTSEEYSKRSKRRATKAEKAYEKMSKRDEKAKKRNQLTDSQIDKIRSEASARASGLKYSKKLEKISGVSSTEAMRNKYEAAIGSGNEGRITRAKETVQKSIRFSMKDLDSTIQKNHDTITKEVFNKSIDPYKNIVVPAVPHEIKEFVDEQELTASWIKEDYSNVQVQYLKAYVDYYRKEIDDNVINNDEVMKIYEECLKSSAKYQSRKKG